MSIKITKIYLDMDGVICNFHARYKQLFGTVPERDDRTNKFGKNFDEFIEGNNFATLDMMEGAVTLIHTLEQLYIHRLWHSNRDSFIYRISKKT